MSQELQYPEYREGYLAKSIFDNPYWKDYPHNPGSDDSIKARRWVDGFAAAYAEKAHA